MRITQQKKVIMQYDAMELESLYNQLEQTSDKESKSYILQNIAVLEDLILMA